MRHGIVRLVTTHHLMALLWSIWVQSPYVQEEQNCPLISNRTYSFILGEIYEGLSTTNQMENKKLFLHLHSASTRENIHSFQRECSHCNLYYILINCGLCWVAPFRKLQIWSWMSYKKVLHVPHNRSIQRTNNCPWVKDKVKQMQTKNQNSASWIHRKTKSQRELQVY